MDFCCDENGVCTKRILSGFKETQSTDNYGSYHDYGPVAESLEGFKKKILEAISGHYEYVGMDEDVFRLCNQAVVEATTSSRQPIAEGYLRELGFQQVGPFPSKKYPDSQVSVWLMGAEEFCKAVGWVEPPIHEYEDDFEDDY